MLVTAGYIGARLVTLSSYVTRRGNAKDEARVASGSPRSISGTQPPGETSIGREGNRIAETGPTEAFVREATSIPRFRFPGRSRTVLVIAYTQQPARFFLGGEHSARRRFEDASPRRSLSALFHFAVRSFAKRSPFERELRAIEPRGIEFQFYSSTLYTIHTVHTVPRSLHSSLC